MATPNAPYALFVCLITMLFTGMAFAASPVACVYVAVGSDGAIGGWEREVGMTSACGLAQNAEFDHTGQDLYVSLMPFQ
jgi:hypothetical protein